MHTALQTPPGELLLIRRHTIINQKNRKRPCAAAREWNFLEKISRLSREAPACVVVSGRRVCVCCMQSRVKCRSRSCFWCCRRQLGNSRCHASGVDSHKILYGPKFVFIPTPFRHTALLQSEDRFFIPLHLNSQHYRGSQLASSVDFIGKNTAAVCAMKLNSQVAGVFILIKNRLIFLYTPAF